MIRIMANFGFPVSAMMIVSGVTLSLCLIWLVFLLSKIMFKDAFTNKIWENVFILIVGFPTLMKIFYGSILGMNALAAIHNFAGDQLYYYYSFIDLEGNFFPFLFLFMIAYLIQFMIRLVRHKKQKAVEFVEKE
jgi:hypothetical protein